jgi:glycosyltransferase involved in cell wall biosynthesis
MNRHPRRIAIVFDDLLGGGAARVATLLAGAWSQQGREVALVTTDDGSLPPLYPVPPGVTHYPLDLRRRPRSRLDAVGNNLKRILTIRRTIRHLKVDVVIAFLHETNILTLLATRGLGVSVIVSERTDPHGRQIGQAWERLRRWTYPLAAAVVAQSEHALSYFSRRIQAHGRVIPNPVSLPQGWTPGPAREHSRLRLVTMGSLRPVKGHDLLIEAFRRIAPLHPQWDLVIYGEGDARRDLESQVEHSGLGSRIRLPGTTPSPFERLKEGHLFVLPSRAEGFPNALAEAMACGLPVVSFDCWSGPSELIRNGVDGLLVPAKSVEALAAALSRLMGDPAERSRLGRNATAVLERFHITKILSQWEEVLGAK